mmetsp:Transcript_22414/g.55739  ORF Transcript_22414/g.55739 Transcript_22414/m.55739 type:complete len:95 (-) Transcript_22414:293-577(-)
MKGVHQHPTMCQSPVVLQHDLLATVRATHTMVRIFHSASLLHGRNTENTRRCPSQRTAGVTPTRQFAASSAHLLELFAHGANERREIVGLVERV